MSAKNYGVVMRIAAVAIAAIVAVSIVLELPLYVPLIAVMVALVIAVVFRRSVKEILADERSRRIQEKATDLAYRIYTIAAAAFALVVVMLRSSLPTWAGIAGETVAYSVCGLMLVHLATSKYYSTKL